MTEQEQGKLNQLYDIQRIISDKVFKEYITDPMEKYLKDQRNNFFSDTLKDSWRKGGRVEGVKEFFKKLDIVQEEIERLKRK